MTESSNVAEVLYRNIAAGRENKIAVYCRDEWLTYGDMVRLTGRVGNALIKLGVEREQRVALLLADGPELVASFYGAAAIGAVPVPLNTFLVAADYETLLNQCRAKVVVVSQAFVYLLEPVQSRCVHLRHVVVVGDVSPPSSIEWNGWIQDAATELRPVEVSPDEPAFWLYSSGSTGRLKGVVHLHRSVRFTCEQYAGKVLALQESDLCFSAAKLFHAYGLGNGMTFPFWVGGASLLWPDQVLAETLFEVIRRFRPTVFFATPALFVGMAALSSPERSEDLGSIRFCVSAGEALPASTFQRWQELFGLEIVDGIGSTEMLHIFISNRPAHAVAGSSGSIVPGYRAKLVNDTGGLADPGEAGDLWVSGESSAAGYWQDRARTQATMVGEWVVTGDKYRQDADGSFWYQGRSDDMLKVNGVWVSPVELENLLSQHPAVRECAVVGVRNTGDLLQIKAFVVLAPGFEPSPELVRQLQNFVRQRAPQRYPRLLEFVGALPKTASGKVRRFELREAESGAVR